MQCYHTGIGNTIAIIEPTFGMKLRMNDSSAKRTASRTLRCVNKPNTNSKPPRVTRIVLSLSWQI